MRDDTAALERQLMLLAGSAAVTLALGIALWSRRDRALGRHPNRDYSHIAPLTRLAVLGSAGISLVWLWLAWQDRKQAPEDSSLLLPLGANALAAAASLLRCRVSLGQAKTGPETPGRSKQIISYNSADPAPGSVP